MTRIGLVSDTHGLLRPEVLDFLRGSDRIVHAGDICGPEVLAALRPLAPLTVVRGNNDLGAWADALNEVETFEVDGVRLLVIHDLARLPAERAAAVDVVIAGHSHKPGDERRGPVRYVNPGSAGPRRFSLPISAGELRIEGGEATVRLVTFSSGSRTGGPGTTAPRSSAGSAAAPAPAPASRLRGRPGR